MDHKENDYANTIMVYIAGQHWWCEHLFLLSIMYYLLVGCNVNVGGKHSFVENNLPITKMVKNRAYFERILKDIDLIEIIVC